jgi:hypothetical protein
MEGVISKILLHCRADFISFCACKSSFVVTNCGNAQYDLLEKNGFYLTSKKMGGLPRDKLGLCQSIFLFFFEWS